MFKHKKLILAVMMLVLGISIARAQMIESRVRKTVKEKRVATIKDKVNELSKKVNLNADQKTKIIDILTKEKEVIDQFLEEAGDKIQEIKNANKKQIDALLTAEQKKKLYAPTENTNDEDDPLKIFKSIY